MSRVERAHADEAPQGWEWFTHRVVRSAEAVDDALGLPATRGVVAMFGEQDRPVLIAATGDCRALARRKLAPDEQGVRAGADLRGFIREVRAVSCGSAFEADLVYLLLARELMPHAAKLVADRWRSWWAQIDPEAPFPEWSKTDLAIGPVAPRSASTNRGAIVDGRGSPIGPFPDKDAAGRFIERMIDAFELCRDHRLLIQAPRANPCAYKEMGRCPAPCDGSEAMDSYRDRVRAAVDAAAGGSGIAACIEREESAMRAAAAARDFEAASRHKAAAERFGRLAGPSAARLTRLGDFQFLLVWRAPKEGWARIAWCDRGFVRWAVDLQIAPAAAKPGSDAVDLCRDGAKWVERQRDVPMGTAEIDLLGLLARERVAPDTRRSAWFVPISRDADPEGLAREVQRAAAAAWKPRKAAAAESAEGPVHELEAVAHAGEGHAASA